MLKKFMLIILVSTKIVVGFGEKLFHAQSASKILFILLLFPLFLFYGGPGAHAADPPPVSASTAILMEEYSGQVLFAKGADVPRPPASTTKIMTALLALKNGRLEQVVTISPKAAMTEESSIYLEAGERILFLDLVKGALIKSGNDACVAIAESVAGSEDVFLWMMNRQACLLGGRSSSFKNTNGLPNKGHYSSALDLALIARYALQNPIFAEIVRTKETIIAEQQGNWPRYLKNTNRLLWKYPGADGVKTGTTDAAGQCLVASATRDGRRLLSVVLNSGDRFAETRAILDYGFDNFHRDVIPRGKLVGRISIINGEQVDAAVITANTISVTVPVEEKQSLERQVLLEKRLRAPVSKGQVVGKVSLMLKGQEVASTPVLALSEVKRASLDTRFRRAWKIWGPTYFVPWEGIIPKFLE
ncbi:MAG: D-alanyl-D-alanine carboxypeptidase family protein [Bacillota bacterium]